MMRCTKCVVHCGLVSFDFKFRFFKSRNYFSSCSRSIWESTTGLLMILSTGRTTTNQQHFVSFKSRMAYSENKQILYSILFIHTVLFKQILINIGHTSSSSYSLLLSLWHMTFEANCDVSMLSAQFSSKSLWQTAQAANREVSKTSWSKRCLKISLQR